MRQVCCNVSIRAEWETILYDLQAMDMTSDMNYLKSYYVYRSPKVGFLGITDRDFLLSQDLVWDYPEKGMMTVYIKSIVDDRMPPIKGKVRATAHMMALVCRPDKDENDNDITHCLFITCVDINGFIPKWAVNIGARSAPTQWFNDV